MCTNTMTQVCQRLGVTTRGVHARMQADRTFPLPNRLAEGGIAFDASEVSAYLATREVQP
jgi:predicted DNA-binding transcriptional regulator AlpA